MTGIPNFFNVKTEIGMHCKHKEIEGTQINVSNSRKTGISSTYNSLLICSFLDIVIEISS